MDLCQHQGGALPFGRPSTFFALKTARASPYRRFKFDKRRQLFIRAQRNAFRHRDARQQRRLLGSENATRKTLCILKSMRHLAPLTLEALSSTMLGP
jgi:hypothetical protein